YSRNHNRGIYTDLTIRQELPAVLKGLAVQGRIAYDHFSNIYENYSKTYVYGSPTVADWLDGEPQLGKAFTGGSESDLGASISTNSPAVSMPMPVPTIRIPSEPTASTAS
ncbi:MAG: hypothetical protein ACOCO5_06230, partial [Segatella copri]